MKLYDLVKTSLELNPELRDSDRKLIWHVWGNPETINKEFFMRATSPESIRRCRQKIQETNRSLRGSKEIRAQRAHVASKRGTHIFEEEA